MQEGTKVYSGSYERGLRDTSIARVGLLIKRVEVHGRRGREACQAGRAPRELLGERRVH